MLRLAVALAFGLAIASGAFLLLENSPTAGSGVIGIGFLLVLPASLSAYVAYLSDPNGEKEIGHYSRVPFYLVGLSLVAGLVLLREGVICVAMLAPIWLATGLGGSMILYAVRRYLRDRGRLFCSALLLAPLLVLPAESGVQPVREERVARTIMIDAPPERVWPLLIALSEIGPGEGRWNLAQDGFGIPRPQAAVVERRGDSLVRVARWQRSVRFEERITRVEPLRAIAWDFAFPDDSVQRHTDRHISPDGAHLRIASGGYVLERLAGGRTRLTLETRYLLRSPLNFYGAWWGNFLLGDIQDNVLAIVRGRAERPAAQSKGSTTAIRL